MAVDSWGKKKRSCDGSSLVDVGEFLAVLECEMVTSTEGRCVVPAYRTLASVGDATNEAASREVGIELEANGSSLRLYIYRAAELLTCWGCTAALATRDVRLPSTTRCCRKPTGSGESALLERVK